jgi:hypothetical protein
MAFADYDQNQRARNGLYINLKAFFHKAKDPMHTRVDLYPFFLVGQFAPGDLSKELQMQQDPSF